MPDNILAGLPYRTVNSTQSIREHTERAQRTLNTLMTAFSDEPKSESK